MPDWHHAPIHRLGETGAYCVTAGTYLKQKFFHSRKRMEMLQDLFFACAKKFEWRLQSWSLFPNHYHFVAYNDNDATSLARMINEFHSGSARELNKLEGQQGRHVWHQFWDTHLTTSGSYLARMKYVNENAVHHGLVDLATNYRWCSASWLERNASGAFINALRRMKIDRVTVIDDFQSGGMAAALQTTDPTRS